MKEGDRFTLYSRIIGAFKFQNNGPRSSNEVKFIPMLAHGIHNKYVRLLMICKKYFYLRKTLLYEAKRTSVCCASERLWGL